MAKKCKQCEGEFEISEEDLNFYEKVSPVFGRKKFLIPPPTLCPDCRHQRRLVWRNERSLYRRKCDKTGETIISWIAPDKPHKAYKNDAWWGDDWNAMDYGRDFDFTRGFFEQFKELIEAVPWMGILIDKTTNSDYTNFCLNVKNCYLCYGSNNDEDCIHSTYLTHCSDCVDLFHGEDSNLCYECVDVNKCYDCKYCVRCNNSNNLIFCENCRGCRDCFGCVNLVSKKYYFMNESLGKEKYKEKIKSLGLGSYKNIQKLKKEFAKHRIKFPMRYASVFNCENSTGEALTNSKNVQECYDVIDAEDSKWIFLGHGGIKDCYDSAGIEDLELAYETVTNGAPTRNVCFSAYAWKGSCDVYYSVLCPNCWNCFGCIGTHKAKYCILNKQYSREQYEELVPRIIKHMIDRGEWGEFFPPALSPFGYNETNALDYFPLTKEEAIKKGFKWSDYEPSLPKVEKTIPAKDLLDDISDVSGGILNSVIECEVSKKPFKLAPKELKFYQKHNLPIPRKHPDERHKERMVLRNPHKLWGRKCDKCGMDLQSPYSPGRPETIYCEKCYLEEVF